MKWVISLGLVLATLLVSAGACAAAPHQVLPAKTLSGTKLSVPGDLPKKPVVFVIGFSKASKTQTSAWSRALRDKLPADTVAVYSVSVIEDVPGFLRGPVASGIRKGVPAALYDTFLLVSERSSTWKAMASYDEREPDSAYVLLMDTARNIVWRMSGSVTAERLVALTNELK